MEKSLWKCSIIWIYLQNIGNVKSSTQSAIRGADVVLRCSFRTTDKVILWLKGKNGLSEGTVIYSHVKPDEFRQRLNITGNHDNGEYHLSIATVKETDEGEYACYMSGNLSFEKFQLSVIEGPTSTTIASKTQDNKLKGTEDQDLTIGCTAVGGDPAPDMVLQIRNQNYTTKSSGTIQHTIPNVDRTYDGAIVICLAGSQSLSYFPVIDTSTIYLILKPSSPTFSLDPVVTEDTKPLSITCTSTGGRPEPTERKWIIGNIDVTSYSTVISSIHDPAADTYTAMSTLTYSVDRSDNGRMLSSGFRNDATGSFITSTRMLDIKYSPSLLVGNKTFNPSDVSRQINCVAKGNPANYMYLKWQHKSKYGTVIRTLEGNNTLTLPQVSDETRYQDTGEYLCSVSNGIRDRDGNVYQHTSGFVFSQASPVFVSGDQQTRFGQIKKDIEIQVEVYSQPIYNSLIWKKGSGTISSSTKYTMSDVPAVIRDTFHGTEVQVDGYKLVLTIHNLEEQDFINYTLRLSNGVGQTAEHLVMLVLSSPPGTPYNFTEIDTTESTVTLQWLPSFDGGHEQMFLIQYRVERYLEWQIKMVPGNDRISPDELQVFTLGGLESGTIYEVRVLAENKIGRSPLSNIEKVVTRCMLQRKQEIHTVIGVSVGLSTISVISLIINIILTHRMVYGKRKETKTESNPIYTDKKSFTEMCYNVANNVDDEDKNSEIIIGNYETLGTKGKPNEYEVLDKGEGNDMSSLNYETLGTKNKPNVYEELDNKTQDSGSKLYSNTLI